MRARLPTTEGLSTLDYEIVAQLGQGIAAADIALALGVPVGQIRKRAANHAVKALVTEYRSRFTRRLAERLADQLVDDAPKNLQFLQSVRDGRIKGEPAEIRLRLQAAETLFGYQFPKRTEKTDDRTVKFVFQKDEEHAIEAILAEATTQGSA